MKLIPSYTIVNSFSRSRLWKARLTNNLFSTADYASKMEEIYRRMYERYQTGEKPDHLIWTSIWSRHIKHTQTQLFNIIFYAAADNDTRTEIRLALFSGYLTSLSSHFPGCVSYNLYIHHYINIRINLKKMSLSQLLSPANSATQRVIIFPYYSRLHVPVSAKMRSFFWRRCKVQRSDFGKFVTKFC